jgi:hypothetical protein
MQHLQKNVDTVIENAQDVAEITNQIKQVHMMSEGNGERMTVETQKLLKMYETNKTANIEWLTKMEYDEKRFDESSGGG